MPSSTNTTTWKNTTLSAQAANFPCMLGYDERRILTYLATEMAPLQGKIVELGCYLGGSTRCLLDGLKINAKSGSYNSAVIHSYDLFIANEFMIKHSLSVEGLAAGDSFLGVFERLLGNDRSFVEIHAGDIRTMQWDQGSIDILFVDILWGWDIQQHVLKAFYTHLTPGRSVIAHQDYVYSCYPWLPICMEYLVEKQYFTVGDYAEYSTVLFWCQKRVDESVCQIDFLRDIPLETQREYIRRSSMRVPPGFARALLQLAEAALLRTVGHFAEADAIIQLVLKNNVGDKIVEEHASWIPHVQQLWTPPKANDSQ